MLKTIFFITLLIFSLIFTLFYRRVPILNSKSEGFESYFENIPSKCPNVLIKKDGKYILKNNRKADIPGVNPIEFDNLEEYVEFIEWQRSQGIRCPVLYLEETNDAQGGISYKMYDNPRNPSYGLPPRRLKKEQKLVDAMHNKGSYPGFDEQNQYVGVFTPLDALHNVENTTAIALEEPSDNAMDTNWGGTDFSRGEIADGKYGEKINRVKRK